MVRPSLVHRTFFLFLFFANAWTKNTTGFVGFVENLGVRVLGDEVGGGDTDAYRSLKLNVSWTPPKGGRQPTSYSVLITGLPRSKTSYADECPKESIFYTSNDASERHAVLPKNPVYAVMPEMPIRPSCSYKIQVFANPRTRPTINSPEIIYTIPKCVGRRCDCAEAGSILPVPDVNAIEREDESVFLNWTVASDYRIRSYVISVGVPILVSKKGLPVYNITKIAEVSSKSTTYLWNCSLDGQPVKMRTDYKISITAMDHRGCYGRDGNIVLPPTRLYSTTARGNVWPVFVLLLVTCILLGALTFALFYGKRKYSLLWTRPPSRIRTIATCKSQWALPILQKRNILYVQADAEEEYGNETDSYEVSYKSVKLLHELGKGQFGKVYLGRLADSDGGLVAVKTSQFTTVYTESETRRQFLEEIEIMKLAGSHPNLVRLVGYCIQPEKPACIILEYMERGDLLEYLRSRRNAKRGDVTSGGESTVGRNVRPSISETLYTTISSAYSASDVSTAYTSDRGTRRYQNVVGNSEYTTEEEGEGTHGNIGRREFLKFARDIVSGMEHLELKKITHRDLAARNILLSSDLTLKISDFGLSRNGVYVIKNVKGKNRHLPIRWMSPEAIRERAFSSKSDVWSFGVVLWEIGTLGLFPYPDVEDDRLVHHIINEHAHLEKPEDISLDIYKLMQHCWATKPEDRPDFSRIQTHLEMLNVPSHVLRSTTNPSYALSV